MKIARILIKMIYFMYAIFYFKNVKLSYLMVKYTVDFNLLAGLKREGDQLVFKNSGNKIFINQLHWFGFLFPMLNELLQNSFVRVTQLEKKSFIVGVSGFQFKVSTLSNMAVLHEIFIQKIYNIQLEDPEVVVVDIGMNVSVASHFFATLPNVKAVYGYEPFPETFQEALYNISLNQCIQSKLIPFNIGVSDVTTQKTITLFESGSLSASTIEIEQTFTKKEGQDVKVELIAAKELLSNITQRHPNNQLLLKIDCEGEEYAILESLRNSGLMQNVTAILVEWHEKGVLPIASFLIDHGFQFHHIPNEKLNCGMVYAFKKTRI
jgi:FkbM family methyltransferase